MKHLWFLALLGLVLAAVVLASDGSGSESGSGSGSGEGSSVSDDGDDNEDPRYSRDREVEVEYSGDELKIKSKAKSGSNKTEWEFEISTHEDDYRLEIESKYRVQIGNQKNESKLQIGFAGLVEYVDVGAAGWQQGEEVRQSSFGRWNAPSCAQNGQLYNCSITTVSNAPSVTVTFTFSGNPTTVNGAVIDPNEIKITVYITNYPYQQSNSSLAIRMLVRQKAQNKERTGKSQAAIQVVGAGFFQWEDTVTAVYADGSQSIADVIQTTVPSNRNDVANWMYFSFTAPQAKNLFWDPFVGVGSPSSAAGLFVSYATVAFAALVAFLL